MNDPVTHVRWAAALLLPLLLVGLVMFAFWIWMLVDALTNQGLDSNEKLIWTVVIVFTHFIGALIYFFIGRPKRPGAGVPRPAGREGSP